MVQRSLPLRLSRLVRGNFCCVRVKYVSINKPEDFNHIRAHNYSILLHETYAGLQWMKKSFLLKQANGSPSCTSVGRGVSATSLRPPVGHRIDPQETSLVLGAPSVGKRRRTRRRWSYCAKRHARLEAVECRLLHPPIDALETRAMTACGYGIVRYDSRPRTDPMRCDRAHGSSV